jgi:hypothetical protein
MFVAAPVRISAAKALIALLMVMNAAAGSADPDNALLIFSCILTIHVTRFVFLDNPSLPDRQHIAKQLPVSEPLRLAVIADCDDAADELLRALVQLATPGLQQVFSHCDFDTHADLLAWLRVHHTISAATYTNWPGRSMTQVRGEATIPTPCHCPAFSCPRDALARKSRSHARPYPLDCAQETAVPDQGP